MSCDAFSYNVCWINENILNVYNSSFISYMGFQSFPKMFPFLGELSFLAKLRPWIQLLGTPSPLTILQPHHFIGYWKDGLLRQCPKKCTQFTLHLQPLWKRGAGAGAGGRGGGPKGKGVALPDKNTLKTWGNGNAPLLANTWWLGTSEGLPLLHSYNNFLALQVPPTAPCWWEPGTPGLYSQSLVSHQQTSISKDLSNPENLGEDIIKSHHETAILKMHTPDILSICLLILVCVCSNGREYPKKRNYKW